AEHDSERDALQRSRGVNSARVVAQTTLEKWEGAGKAGCSMPPQPRTQNKNKRTSVVTTGSPKHSGLPCAMVLTAYSALSSATNSSCHRHWRISSKVRTRLGRQLDTSNGCQDHTVLP